MFPPSNRLDQSFLYKRIQYLHLTWHNFCKVETDNQDAKSTGGWPVDRNDGPWAQRIQVTVGTPRRTVSHGHTIASGCKPPAPRSLFFLNSTLQRRVGPGPGCGLARGGTGGGARRR
jgi:hypothetical protein